MNRLPLLTALGLLLAFPAVAAEPAQEPNKPVTMTFYITGLECAGCAYNVTNSLNDVKGFVDARIDSLLDGYANITFDERKATVHQIAQAVASAYPLHGKAYDASLKLRIPDYAKGDNATRVETALAKLKTSISLIIEDKAKGLLHIRFQPLALKENASGPQGTTLAQIQSLIRDPAPTGLGLACELVSEGQTPQK